jgi:uncharacterized protein (TIGR03083 family)
VRPLDPLLLAAYDAQALLTGAWLAALTDADLELPSRLEGWRVAELVAHLVRSARSYVEAEPAPRGATATSVGAYVAGYTPAAEVITAHARTTAKELSLAGARARFADSVAAVAAVPADDIVVLAPWGPIRRSDLLRTRVLELVVHALDVDGGPALDRQAVRVCVRLLAQILGERQGGKAVEVRVPPYAAVQIGEGVTHTRGTPPNVVEMAPEVFVTVATGRRPWAAAVEAGDVRASGLRADLSPYLPLL